MSDWTGDERRKAAVSRPELESLTGWVRDIDGELKLHTKAEARMDERISQIETDMREVRDDIKTILDIVSKAKGAWWLMGLLATIAGTLIGAFVWAKEHVK